MKTRFAAPEERDLRFTRNTNLLPRDFGQEVKLIDSATDAGVLVVILVVVLVLYSVFG